MSRRALVVAPLLLVVLLSGCAGPADDGSNPLKDFEKVIDLVPWATSTAADASAEQLTVRISEITAGLPSLDMSDAERTAIETRLQALSAVLAADPSNTAVRTAELNAAIDEVKAAIQ